MRVSQLRLRGVVTIDIGAPAGIGLFVFTALAADGALRASDEGSLEWVPLSGVRALPIVPDVAVLLERLETQPEGAPPFNAHSRYDERDGLVITFDASNVIK